MSHRRDIQPSHWSIRDTLGSYWSVLVTQRSSCQSEHHWSLHLDAGLRHWSQNLIFLSSGHWLLTVKVEGRCFHLEKVALRKRERLTAVFLSVLKILGRCRFYKRRDRAQRAPGRSELEDDKMIRVEIYCESSDDNEIIWSDVSCTCLSEQIFNLGMLQLVRKERWHTGDAIFILDIVKEFVKTCNRNILI